MKLKICFNNEIHMISKLPDTYKAFIELLKSKFHTQLPNNWTLQYTDSDGDNILINDERDYEDFINPEPNSINTTAKVYVVSTDLIFSPQESKVEEIIEKIENKQEDDYQIIQKEEIKPEEIIPEETQEIVPQEPVVDNQEQNDVQEEEEEEKVEFKTQEKTESVPSEVQEGKVLVDLDDLSKMIASIIDSKMSQVAGTIKKQLDDQNLSLVGSVILEEVQKPSVPQVKHFGVSCSNCQAMPIVGIRYKCTVCPRFDFCENCEESCEHSHNMIKMKQRDLLDIFRPNPQARIEVLPVNEGYPGVVVENKVPEKVEKVEKIEKKKRMSKREKREERKASNIYFKALKEKAEKLQKCFPKEDFDILCAYVNGAPEDMTFEELVENFKH